MESDVGVIRSPFFLSVRSRSFRLCQRSTHRDRHPHARCTRPRTQRGSQRARIFFSNLIYRQFDGRKTRRHFCSPPPPLSTSSTYASLPRPRSLHPSAAPWWPLLLPLPAWRGVKLLKFITPDIRRGVKTRNVLRGPRG